MNYHQLATAMVFTYLSRASQLGLPLPWELLDPGQGNGYEPVYGRAADSGARL